MPPPRRADAFGDSGCRGHATAPVAPEERVALPATIAGSTAAQVTCTVPQR